MELDVSDPKNPKPRLPVPVDDAKRKPTEEDGTENPEPETRLKRTAQLSGRVKVNKPSFFKRLASAFFGEELDNIGEYIIFEVIIPGAKVVITEIGHSALDMLLYGDERGSRRSGSRRDHDHISYHAMHDDRNLDNRDRRLERHEFEVVVFRTRRDAIEVLNVLTEIAEQYDTASVEDFKQACHMKTSYTDAKYGWDVRDLRMAQPKPDRRGGFYLDLPRPRVLS